MTTRRWMIAIALLALWLAFVARAERLRRVSRTHMMQFALQNAEARAEFEPEAYHRARSQAAWHLRMATAYNVEADFVESFTLALGVAGLLFGVILVLRARRKPPPQGLEQGNSPLVG